MKSQLSIVVCLLLAFVAANPAREGRIAGGYDNVNGEIPWAVSLRNLQGEHFCTGSIVNNWWIVTAANCVGTRNAASIGMLMGRVTLDGTGGIQRQGFRVVTHPSYNPDTMNFDVGLVQTSVIIVFSATVQPIFLSDTTSGIVLARSSGWGQTGQDMGPTSNNLRTLEIFTLLNDECRARTTPWAAERITVNMICTANEEHQGFCGTGVGGSLVHNNRLIGIASWNIPCGFGWPDKYVRVSQVRTWILSITGNQ